MTFYEIFCFLTTLAINIFSFSEVYWYLHSYFNSKFPFSVSFSGVFILYPLKSLLRMSSFLFSSFFNIIGNLTKAMHSYSLNTGNIPYNILKTQNILNRVFYNSRKPLLAFSFVANVAL